MTRVYSSDPSRDEPITRLLADVQASYVRGMQVEVRGAGYDAVLSILQSQWGTAVARGATVGPGVWVDVGGNRFGLDVRHVPRQVTIGTRVWAKQNVRAATYVDGGEITKVSDTDEWARMRDEGRPAWTYNTGGEGTEVLYNAHVDFGRMCPVGYRVPTYADWKALRTYYRAHPLTPDATVAASLADGPFGAQLTGYIDRDPDDGLYAEGYAASWWIDKRKSFYIERRAEPALNMAKLYNKPVEEARYYGLSLRLIRA
jgi:uncharacterized protein (TIGR02145 family)